MLYWLESRRGAGSLLLLAAASVLISGCSSSDVPPAELLAQAQRALSERKYVRAEKIALQISESSPEWADAMVVAGEAATKAGRLRDALRHYRALSGHNPGSPDSVKGSFYAAEIWLELGELAAAETAYRTVIAHEPNDAATHGRLAFLLSATGRGWEARTHYWFLLKNAQPQQSELIMLADPDRPVAQLEFLRKCAEKAPDDYIVKLGLAANAIWDGQYAPAEKILREVIAAAPELTQAHAFLGELFVGADAGTFRKWYLKLPPDAEASPHICYVFGLRARIEGRLREAARSFWEAIRLVPSHRSAHLLLGQVLLALHDPAAQDFIDRAEQLAQLTRALDDVMRSEWRNERPVRQCVELFCDTGRYWEACAWCQLAHESFPQSIWPVKIFSELSPTLTSDPPQTLDSANLTVKYDFARFPRYQPPGETSLAERPPSSAKAEIRFDGTQRPDLNFVYFNAPDPKTNGVRMFEANGGGVAVLDYDGNGRPDLFFTQGAEWPTGADEPTESAAYTDRLFRNRRDKFEDVALMSGLAGRGFGQGCATGDFDGDGFVDVYVANVGRNRLYRNNGDGTFADVTDAAGITQQVWTASCVIIDLNRDGHPDLFDVNYLQGKDLYKIICNRLACSPSNFKGAPDVVLLNRGDGSFETLDGLTPQTDAKGLGVLAFFDAPQDPPQLFIANDQVANFLLRNNTPADSTGLKLTDEAFARGVALSNLGTALGCMGVAADDVDGNGLVDLFVTNYADESNTLYLQDTPGIFNDATGAAGLMASSFQYVGWGTQFLDADLDGNPDLVIANGHVDDYRERGGQYHMWPQFFRNLGRARFEQLPAAEVGDYFDHKYLGRGLVKLDWNLDGRMDFAVSNIGDPVSLVTNRSQNTGHFLNFRLHARNSPRDALGARLTLTAGDKRWTKQLTAGDGFQASNERLIQFGVAGVTQIDRIEIEWPSRSITSLSGVPVDATYEIVENQHLATRWTGAVPKSFSVDASAAPQE